MNKKYLILIFIKEKLVHFCYSEKKWQDFDLSKRAFVEKVVGVYSAESDIKILTVESKMINVIN